MVRGRKQTRKGEGHVTQDCSSRHRGNLVRRWKRARTGSECRAGTRRSDVHAGGAAYFASKDDSPSFGNYGFGTAVTFNLNRFVGIEGELGAMLATTSDLQFGDLSSDIKAPNMLNYTANVVVSPGAGRLVRSVRSRRRGRPHDVRAACPRCVERRNLSHRQCRRRREVVSRQTSAGDSAAIIALR